jgi:creatinine amidohydrolase/Fe(II)-dependent formamide hydrolase-like protein
MEDYILGKLTWVEAEKKFKTTDLAILPVGSLEQHGRHLPLDTDSFDASWLARKVVSKVKEPKPLVLPIISYGVSYHHLDFPGTISISPRTLAELVYEIAYCLRKWGIRKIVIINGHGGNKPALLTAAQRINKELGVFVCVETGELISKDKEKIIKTKCDVHSGEYETSTSLANRKEYVNLKEAKRSKSIKLKFPSKYLEFGKVPWTFNVKDLSSSGALGAPEKATENKGKKLWDLHVKKLVSLIEDLKE